MHVLVGNNFSIVFCYINLESSATPLLRQSPRVAAAKLARRFTHSSFQPNLPQDIVGRFVNIIPFPNLTTSGFPLPCSRRQLKVNKPLTAQRWTSFEGEQVMVLRAWTICYTQPVNLCGKIHTLRKCCFFGCQERCSKFSSIVPIRRVKTPVENTGKKLSVVAGKWCWVCNNVNGKPWKDAWNMQLCGWPSMWKQGGPFQVYMFVVAFVHGFFMF